MKKDTLKECGIYFAKTANQQVWKLLQKRNRTKEENELMIHSAHASSYHWLEVGTQVHNQRSHWLLSRVYTVTKDAPNALKHAKRCMELTEKYPKEMKDFDLAYAYEALARANFLSRQSVYGNRYLETAKKAGEKIKNLEDKTQFFNDLKFKN
jgi:rubrerythrin